MDEIYSHLLDGDDVERRARTLRIIFPNSSSPEEAEGTSLTYEELVRSGSATLGAFPLGAMVDLNRGLGSALRALGIAPPPKSAGSASTVLYEQYNAGCAIIITGHIDLAAAVAAKRDLIYEDGQSVIMCLRLLGLIDYEHFSFINLPLHALTHLTVDELRNVAFLPDGFATGDDGSDDGSADPSDDWEAELESTIGR